MKSYILILNIFLFINCQTNQHKEKYSEYTEKKLEKVTFGGGCFWCLSPCFEMIKGVNKVTSGYSGGYNDYPTFQQVSSGLTDHAEVIQIEYDPEYISFSEILDIFWFLHDPTQLNRQGIDIGSQYRSIILYRNEEQKILSQESLKKSQSTDLWKGKYVTQIVPFVNFFPAEDFHQEYYQKNPSHPYCISVIAPKIEKFRTKFNYKLKPEFKRIIK
ncbi:peptide-methionine (S)-S-oxide reductase MsrA [Apibacter adventoris]|uniref:peptide-methionine (S)-S-oxide reductase MsrA n=1 Tax=Apibacter adventoris TaxID=1679466 RepID=UPI000CF5E673|nr:peptide-methionine (S)-S-oxide reductase MsrA [Apibacter adventoris]PQL95606.1 peptide-methionine (S)-S-oxide reductase [Apibacter adventoris]